MTQILTGALKPTILKYCVMRCRFVRIVMRLRIHHAMHTLFFCASWAQEDFIFSAIGARCP